MFQRPIVKWFKGYELALAMAINMGFGRMGSALGTALSFDIARQLTDAKCSLLTTLCLPVRISQILTLWSLLAETTQLLVVSRIKELTVSV